MKKRIISLLTALALSLSLFPVWAGAAGTDGTLCPHHPAHDGDCGFAAPSEGHPCGHTHTAACYTNGQLPGGADYETAPDAQELLNCPHVHDAECGFAEPNGGTDCAFVCNICPVEALIAQLPAEVTPDNAGDVRAQLEEILALFAALDEVEQGNVDISRCTELQAALDAANVAAPVEVITELDLSNKNKTEDTINHYKWEPKKEDPNEADKITSWTLTLSDGFTMTKVIIPDTTVTIESTGTSTIGKLTTPEISSGTSSTQNTNLTFSGKGKLTIEERLNLSGGKQNSLTINENAHVKAKQGIEGGEGGDFPVIVNGTLEAEASDGYSAILAGKVVVGNTGELKVYATTGMTLYGNSGNFSEAFTVKGDGCFTANCSEYIVRVMDYNVHPFTSTLDANDVIKLDPGYLPADCEQKLNAENTKVDLYKKGTTEIYNGPITIHKTHKWPDPEVWYKDDAEKHWVPCEYTPCDAKKPGSENPHDFSEWTSDNTQHQRTCSTCKREETGEHDWEAKLAESGSYVISCKVCGYEKNSVAVTVSIPNALTYGQTDTVKPTYTINPGQTFTFSGWELNGDPLTLDTNGFLPKKLPVGTYTLICKGTQADSIKVQGSATFKVDPAPLTVASVTAQGRPYDGTNTVDITNVELSGKVDGDEVFVNTAGLKGTVSDPNAGESKPVTLPELKLTGAAASNYTLIQPASKPSVNISKARATPKNGDLPVVNKQAHTYTYGLGALWPDISADKSLGSPISYELGTVSLDSYYTGGAKIEGQQTLSLPIQAVQSDKTENIGTVTVIIHTGNYADMTATINVRSVNKKLPVGQPTLTPPTLTCGQPLSTIKLSGSMKDRETGADVPGEFAWSSPDNRPTEPGIFEGAWKFTPNDNDTYAIEYGTAAIVCKIRPDVKPTLSKDTLLCGEKLSTIKLTNDNDTPGEFAWNEPDRSFDVPGGQSVLCTFTPDNTNIYEIVPDVAVSITVQSSDKNTPDVAPKLSGNTLTYRDALRTITLSNESGIPGGFTWVEPDFCPDAQEAYQAEWIFTPADTGKYNTVKGKAAIKVLPLSIENAEITLDKKAFTYDGKAPQPDIVNVKLKDAPLAADKDYTSAFEGLAGDSKYIVVDSGTPNCTVTLTGTGNYTGTAQKKFHVIIDLGEQDGKHLGVDVEPGIPKVPDGLTNNEEWNTTDKIQNGLKHRIKIEWVDSDVERQTEFFDVALQYFDEVSGTWKNVDPDNFPPNGVTAILPYPQNTGPNGFEFKIKHLVTADSPVSGKKAGEVEDIDYVLTADGLKCKFTSLSPVAIAYRAAAPSPTPSGGGSSGGGSSSRTHPVKTEQSDHGSITAAPSSASPGATITLTVSPDSGYRLDALTVTDAGGKSVKLTARPDGTYTFLMPNSAVTVTASFTSGDPEETCPRGKDCPSLKFVDLGGIGTWYHEAVDYVLLNALMSGYGNATFGPNDNVTRAQFAQILYNRAGHPAVTGPSGFTDVLPGAWYAPAVTWAAGQGVVLGYGNGLFGPDDSITREQLAAMLWRYAGRPVATEKELHFSDADKISPYALDALCWAVENGIVNGMGNNILSPQGLATRAQVAQMLMNYLENT